MTTRPVTSITDEQLTDLERSDEFSLRHMAGAVQLLIDSYRAAASENVSLRGNCAGMGREIKSLRGSIAELTVKNRALRNALTRLARDALADAEEKP
jgi:hypothetical protein